MKLRKEISEGEMLPAFYGVAWRRWECRTTVCYPVPLNWIAAWAVALWAFVKVGNRNIDINPRIAYLQGVRDGRAVNEEDTR